MKIYYQWELWAYSHIASLIVSKELWLKNESNVWMEKFLTIWESINNEDIWVLPIENSYAWSIHENMYNFLRYDYEVIWEIELQINHCLLSKWNKIEEIHKVFSHPQALSQCYNFLKNNNIEWVNYQNTATAAKMISEQEDCSKWAIASAEAASIYNLNILKQNIQDQDGNTTRFFIIKWKNNKLIYPIKKNKVTIIFEARNIPASLYKCLWAFATNNINLTKIESLPSLKDPFSYIFWLDFEWNLNNEKVLNAINELKFFTKNYKILWEY